MSARAALLVALLWLPGVARAQAESSVTALADELHRRIASTWDRDPLELGVALSHDLEDAPRPDALLEAVAARVLLRSADDARVVAADRVDATGTAEDAVARAAARGYGRIVHGTVRVVGHRLVVETLAFESGGGFRAVFAPRPAEVARFTVEVPLDSQLRAFVAPLPVVTDRTVVARPVALPGRGYTALAVSDIDRDGQTEIFLAARDRVDVVRLGIGRGTRLRARRVASMAIDRIATAPSRIRRPIGTALVADDRVLFRLSDHARALDVHLTDGRLSWSATDEPCADGGFPLMDACATPVTGRDYFHRELAPRTGEETAPAEAPAGFYARVAASIRQPDGSEVAHEAVVTPRGRLAVRVGEARGGAVGYGAALAMHDLDADGQPELLVSGNAAPGAPERISLLRIRPDGGVIAVWTSEDMRGPVFVAGAGDVDSDGGTELLAIEEPPPGAAAPARLWLVR